MTARLLILSLCFLAATGASVRAMRPEIVALREPLASVPLQLAKWTGREEPRFDSEIETVLGVDEYLNRSYIATAEVAPLFLYVGYYQSQRQGDTIHSPLNCLPGAGWLPQSTSHLNIPVANAAPMVVNRVTIQKGLDRMVVLYWYQSHGRIVASEYWSKAYMIYDAVRLNRSDAAMIRVVSPVVSGDEAAAERRATEFVQALHPELGKYLPS